MAAHMFAAPNATSARQPNFTTSENTMFCRTMPDEKKITLANSTGSNPDLALGLSYYRPAEFAMRGMAVDLLEFDDFLDWYGAEYNLRALAPMAYEDGVYGASETQEFYVLFYRKDILDSLGLTVPDTWEDVKAMMPVLHRNAMNFNLPRYYHTRLDVAEDVDKDCLANTFAILCNFVEKIDEQTK